MQYVFKISIFKKLSVVLYSVHWIMYMFVLKSIFVATCLHHSCDLINFFAQHGITCARGTSIFGRNITTCSARYNFTVSEFLAGTVDINALVRQYCRNTENKDQARMYQFMRDLIACRDWYDRDSGCILSRDELCDIIIFWLLIDY